MNMDFGANKTSVEVIWKEFDGLKNTEQKHYCSSYYVSVNKYEVDHH